MITIPTELIRNKELTNADTCILGLIYNCNCLQCFLSQEMIRKKLGFSYKAISQSLTKLCKLEYINYISLANKRYKLIEPTEKFFKYFKKRANIKASYRDYRKKEKAPKFTTLKNREMTSEEKEECSKLARELLNK